MLYHVLVHKQPINYDDNKLVDYDFGLKHLYPLIARLNVD